MFAPTRTRSTYQAAARRLGDRWLSIVRPIRVLDAVRWDESIEREFLAGGGRELPKITQESYSPLHFDAVTKRRELLDLDSDVCLHIGRADPLGQLLSRRCRQALAALELLNSRGTPRFSRLARKLYGAPTPADNADVDAIFSALAAIVPATSADDKPDLDATAAAGILDSRLRHSMPDAGQFRIRTLDRLSAHAAACGRSIRLRRSAWFSHADIAALEVHEGWVHLGTTLNARRQTVCEFLVHALPATTAAQEGLAVLCELLAGVCPSHRVRRLYRRYQAVRMADDGADFLDVFRFFLADGGDAVNAYRQAARIFRGSLPSGVGPFAKDRTYALGLVRLLRVCRPARLKLLFAGKTALSDLPMLEALIDNGIVIRPAFIPPSFAEKSIVPFFRRRGPLSFLRRSNDDLKATG